MILHNSYIFLSKTKKQDDTKNKNLNNVNAELGRSVYSLLKKTFCFSPEDINRSEYFKRTANATVKVDNISFAVEFSIIVVEKKTFLDVSVNHTNKVQAIKCLEFINEVLNNENFEEHFIVIISYDAVSEYYCNKMYPILNEFERSLRKLLFNIYIFNFGKNYYSQTIKPELQSKIKGVVQAKGNEEKKEIERLKKFFYSLEYNDIQILLFEEKWTILEEQWKTNFLNENNDLTKLSDVQLRKAIDNISPKSDWERFFIMLP